MANQTDIELIKNIGNGNTDALENLFKTHYMSVYRLAYRWCRIREDAEDITQEVFIKLVRKLHTFNQKSSFRTWLYRITMNTAKDFVRQKTRKKDVEMLTTADPDLTAAEPAENNPVTPGQLMAEIDRLPVKLKKSVILVLAEGMTHREAAEILGCKEKTISWRIHKARKQLKTRLKLKSI